VILSKKTQIIGKPYKELYHKTARWLALMMMMMMITLGYFTMANI
jgi:hypothetical protein